MYDQTSTLTPAQQKEQELKWKAKYAADTIIEAEKHRKDPELKKHLKSEFKDRSKALEAAMGAKKEKEKKAAPKKAAPAKKAAKPAPKKKK